MSVVSSLTQLNENKLMSRINYFILLFHGRDVAYSKKLIDANVCESGLGKECPMRL